MNRSKILKITKPKFILNDTGRSTDLFLYPNPATENVTCMFNQGDLIEIMDLTGRIVSTQQILQNNLTLSIDISILAPSSYVLVLKAENSILKESKLNAVR